MMHNYSKTKLKIVAVFDTLPTMGGGYQYALSIWEGLNELDARRYDIIAIALSKETEDGLNTKGIKSKLVCYNLGHRAFRRLSWLSRNGDARWTKKIAYMSNPLLKVIDGMDPDLIIFTSVGPFVLGEKHCYIAPVHDLMHRYTRFPEHQNRFGRLGRDELYKEICRSAAGILVDSEVGKEQLMECFSPPSEKVFVLPFVPPPYIYELLNSEEPELLSEFALPDRYILYPAQLWRHKNHINLLHAIRVLRNNGIYVNAVFCGSGKNAQRQVLDVIRELDLIGQIYYIGYVSDRVLVQLYKKAVAMVMPTMFGPTNIPPLEAFALGCPVAVSDIFAMREQVGEAGLYFNPAVPNDIASAIGCLWTDSNMRDSLRDKGFAMAARWNKKTFGNEIERIIHKSVIHRCLPNYEKKDIELLSS
jgi:glycosyltransferase involved in cell wall biosynthesis